MIAEPEILAAPKETVLKLGMPQERMLLLAEPGELAGQSHASWRTLLEHGEQDWVKFDDLETAMNTPAFLLFSSGTTGKQRRMRSPRYRNTPPFPKLSLF